MSKPSARALPAGPQRPPQRAYWLKTLHQWHWISSAVCLVGMLLFAITGITLNNAGHIDASPKVVARKLTLPTRIAALLRAADSTQGDKTTGPLPARVRTWLQGELGIALGASRAADAEWSPGEVYLSLPQPGGDAWLRIDRESGELEYEHTDRGWLSYLNDLHKGRHTGAAWSWFLDVFALACVVFCVTGLLILKMHAAQRASTWPIVAAGLAIPLLLALMFIH